MSLSLTELGFKPKEYRDFCPDSDEVSLRRPTPGKSLELTVNGSRYEVSRIASAFPLTSSMETVVFFDTAGDEIGCLKKTKTLDGESQSLLKSELEKAYFMPRIRAILAMQESLGIESWRVVTDKGERDFEVRDARNSVRHIERGRVLIKDVDGNRYEIPNWQDLDRRSVYLLMRHL